MISNEWDQTADVTWPLLTINILTYNRRDEVRASLYELQNLDYPRERLEILVVDNASSDGTGEMLAAEFPAVKVIVIAKNCGVAGWNEGFKAGRGDYFLVLDDDSTPQQGVKAAIAYLQANPLIGVLACNIEGGLYTTEGFHDKQKTVGFVGCGAFIRRAVVEKVGGYARWIHLYSHEWEYSIRCMESGYEIRYFADCVIRHRSSSTNRSSRTMVSYSTRNEMLIVHKYFGKQRRLYLLRTLIHSAWLWTREGGKIAPLWVLQGFWMFLRAAPRHRRKVVKPAVQKFYAETFWSTQPVARSILAKLRILPKLQPPAPSCD